MNNQDTYLADGRECFVFPWASEKLPRPWKNGYTRVIIPLTKAEKINSSKKCHIQIVRTDKLKSTK